MAYGMTYTGCELLLKWALRKETPNNLYIALVTTTPTVATDHLSELTEIAPGNGYASGGYALTPGPTDFDNSGKSTYGWLQLKDIVWSANGGPIPASGNNATYAVLTDDNVTVGNRKVVYFWDLAGAWSIIAGQLLDMVNLEVRQYPKA